MARIFVAIGLPDEARAEAARAAEVLRPRFPRARWVPSENLHATIAFLGSVEDVEWVVEAVGRAAAPFPRAAMRLEGAGAFPSARRARVLWAGLAGDVAVLSSVAAAVADALGPIGFEPEQRPFAAHVTLARLPVPEPAGLEGIVVGPVPFVVEGLGVYRSHLGRPAPRYERVAFAPFLG